jgi:hypothetical protein
MGSQNCVQQPQPKMNVTEAMKDCNLVIVALVGLVGRYPIVKDR